MAYRIKICLSRAILSLLFIGDVSLTKILGCIKINKSLMPLPKEWWADSVLSLEESTTKFKRNENIEELWTTMSILCGMA